MEKIYLVVIELYNDEENSIVDICTTREKAEELMNEYVAEGKKNFPDDDEFSYRIDEVELDESKDILWDCYRNSRFLRK